ncbi:MAG: GntR family transcriptional regulator [Clostridium tyrobutyricum]|jgi:DNA-binding transcriptional regulator YhcF (GntR family)|uniref:Transcriptional regulator, GntR family n=2 Tax=Clostridium tyrobutyricum TaxID=1519 RepID=W6N214_CLOTY|nr:GntR family transcriptional regulator [Clostridium tyrobutyricum]CDL90358.1 Transcriptional regulator, GntR family [Clostridium tyrobutyricum DIVETGP]AND86090.1 transcriptional regulator, GntR family [Clostridium tyrobutyricum]ANP70914.1 GntR family transcriptional regulator [Clostridium tyrobutyricum]MCH4199492.1 GntR family transcriptional regulator [Clostridium tyrobutyricum]MCH4258797.1 GntR family transcriptional regulator [Clostridium tyrobutyricum]
MNSEVVKIDIKLNKDTSIPLYIQLKKQIMYLIKNNILKVGNKMPTERELSSLLKVSRNTISTAYNELEQEGVLKSYQGRGTFVAEDVNPWKIQNVEQKIAKFIDLAFEEALEIGIDSSEFLEIITKRIKEKRKIMSKINAIYVECNIEQSKMFSKQLMESTDINVIPLTISDLKDLNNNTKNILENSQVVIATFNHVNEVTHLIKEFKKEVIGVAINVDLETIVKIARYPEKTKFAFVCISNEFMFKARGALERAGLGNIDIEYTNTINRNKLKNIIENSDVVITSPGRYKSVRDNTDNNKIILKFLYNLDDDSIKSLKSKIVELKYKN